MAARLGVVTRMGLGEALMMGATPLRFIIAPLIIVALGLGNAAYQAGNLTGAALGGQALLGAFDGSRVLIVLVLTVLTGVLLMTGTYRLLERVLIGLVLLMSLAFAGSLVMTRPDFGAMIAGLVPRLPEASLFTTMALIGTTIVPYNLFLHAATASQKWKNGGEAALKEARTDTIVSVGLGGLISIFILVTAAASLFGAGLDVKSAGDFARAIEPAYGPLAKYLVGIGLLAAGFSSALTAPMAAAYAVCELNGQPLQGKLFRAVALGILVIGALISLAGFNPLQLIMTAQAANGVLLPIIALFLLITMNRKALLGAHVNSLLQNVMGGFVLLVALGLGVRLILRAAGVWP
jgi:manganese transport protein